jgi:hypothetical protein
MSSLVIHRDGFVTRGSKVVGECSTGEDGLAYVDFYDQADMPTADQMFTIATCEWL